MENISRRSGEANEVLITTAQLTEAARQALRERSVQARTSASAAVERYAVLLAQAQARIVKRNEHLQAIDAIRQPLRESVQRYARLLKALETPPERMLRLVKEILTDRVRYPEHELETKMLLDDVVWWSVDAYYSNAPAA